MAQFYAPLRQSRLMASRAANDVSSKGNKFRSDSLNPCRGGLKIKDAEEAGVSRLYAQVFTVPFLTEPLMASCLFRKQLSRWRWPRARRPAGRSNPPGAAPRRCPAQSVNTQSGTAQASQNPQLTQRPAADAATAQDSNQDPLNRQLSDKEKFKQQKEVREELKGPYKKWVNEDVHWIITDQELKAFKSLSNDEERDNFIEQFWLRRNPNPDSPENEFREEHYRRIAYANEHFAAGKPGWKTDRGHIYISFGKPDSIDSHPSGGAYERPMEEGGGETSTFPFEVWHYRYLEGVGDNIDLEFVDTCMCGDYHFTINRAEKDALLHTPGAGLTQAESLGMAKKADRFNGGMEQLGTGPMSSTNQSKQFDRIELMAKIMAPPPIKYKDLDLRPI